MRNQPKRYWNRPFAPKNVCFIFQASVFRGKFAVVSGRLGVFPRDCQSFSSLECLHTHELQQLERETVRFLVGQTCLWLGLSSFTEKLRHAKGQMSLGSATWIFESFLKVDFLARFSLAGDKSAAMLGPIATNKTNISTHSTLSEMTKLTYLIAFCNDFPFETHLQMIK